MNFVESREECRAIAVAVSGDYAYILDRYYGLHIVNISNKSHPEFTGYWHQNDLFQTLVYENNFVYILASPRVYIINVTNPEEPFLAGSYYSPNEKLMKLCASNELLIIRNFYNFEIIDVSNPNKPTILYQYEGGDRVTNLYVEDNEIFVATELREMIIFDISIPTSPSFVSNTTIGYGRFIEIYNNYAFIANYSSITIFNVTDSLNVTLINAYTRDDMIFFRVHNEMIIFPFASTKIGLIDISNITNLYLINEFNTYRDFNTISCESNYLYLTSQASGLIIFDIGDPKDPQEISDYELWFPGERARIITIITISVIFSIICLSLIIWQRKNIWSGIKEGSSWLKRQSSLTLVLMTSIVYFVTSLFTFFIVLTLRLNDIQHLFFYLEGPATLLVPFFAILITTIIFKFKKQEEWIELNENIKLASSVFLGILYFFIWTLVILFAGMFQLDSPREITYSVMFLIYSIGSFLCGLIIAYTTPQKNVKKFSIIFTILIGIYLTSITAFYCNTIQFKAWILVLLIIGTIGTCCTLILTAMLFSKKFNKETMKSLDN